MTTVRLAKPLTTAYLLGLLSTASPRLASILLLFAKRKLTPRAAWLQSTTSIVQSITSIVQSITSIVQSSTSRVRPLTQAPKTIHTLRQALSVYRFPTFSAVLVGGSTLLQFPIKALLDFLLSRLTSSPSLHLRLGRLLARFLAALISASVSFTILNNAPPTAALAAANTLTPGPFDEPPEQGSIQLTTITPDLAGRTMDLTLFAVVRALDVVISTATSRLSPSSSLRKTTSKLPTPLFCFSAATIMWSWFYSPSRLPRSYNAWISAAAELDHRLVLALRHARYGTFQYGKDTGMAPLLGSMARDYGLPEDAGDPAKTVPVPCELVHMGCGTSCEKHALWRFWRGWTFAAKMYFPLQALVLLRHLVKTRRPGNRVAGLSKNTLFAAVTEATRRSSFLGAFIALFYYGVCLSRTRLGPKLFPKTVTPQMWDSGLCVLSGCLACGLSILAEEAKRRLEIVLFVLPRAAATWFPRRYLPENRWREHVAFAVSAAVVMTAAQEDHRRVRGVLGRVLHRVLAMD